jgi:hypothetical protein
VNSSNHSYFLFHALPTDLLNNQKVKKKAFAEKKFISFARRKKLEKRAKGLKSYVPCVRVRDA